MYTKSTDFDAVKSSGLKRKELEGIISTLAGKYGAERIYLFGSLATGNWRMESDIDLAVEGVAKEVFFQAFGEILFRTARDVDLIDLSEAKDPLQRRIKREGRLIYER